MKILMVGLGKMGGQIKTLCQQIEHSQNTLKTVDPQANGADFKSINEALSAQQFDVALEFTKPQSLEANLEILFKAQIPTVIGTTGWQKQVAEISAKVKQHQTVAIYSANFSIGMNLFMNVLDEACLQFARFPQYDVAGIEFHHRQKIDSPSGTALELGQQILTHMKGKKKINTQRSDQKIAEEDLHFASVRMGYVPGTHTIFFDSEADSIEITHRARNRAGFAEGALWAAAWAAQAQQQKKVGLFHFRDCLKTPH